VTKLVPVFAQSTSKKFNPSNKKLNQNDPRNSHTIYYELWGGHQKYPSSSVGPPHKRILFPSINQFIDIYQQHMPGSKIEITQLHLLELTINSPRNQRHYTPRRKIYSNFQRRYPPESSKIVTLRMLLHKDKNEILH
jgi:hypothetical protein